MLAASPVTQYQKHEATLLNAGPQMQNRTSLPLFEMRLLSEGSLWMVLCCPFGEDRLGRIGKLQRN